METLVVTKGPRSTLDSCEYRRLLEMICSAGPIRRLRLPGRAGRWDPPAVVRVPPLAWTPPACFGVSAEGMEVAGRRVGVEPLRRWPPAPRVTAGMSPRGAGGQGP